MTVAGNGVPGFGGDGGPATSASLNAPTGVAVDRDGNLYIVDELNERVRRVDARTWAIATIAGNGDADYSGDGGAGPSAALNDPVDVAVDAAGNVYVTDEFNDRVRRIDRQTGVITTLAGNGSEDGGGDGGPAASASLVEPEGVAFDDSGNLLIVDTYNFRLRRVDGMSGVISTIAGTVVPGTSGDGGPATRAMLEVPFAVVVDGGGNLFIADTYGQRIRRIDAATGTMTTIAGNLSLRGYHGDDGPATEASIGFGHGLVIDGSGNLIVADSSNNALRLIKGVAVPRKAGH
jgi:sugar lactone lactonase YvrE